MKPTFSPQLVLKPSQHHQTPRLLIKNYPSTILSLTPPTGCRKDYSPHAPQRPRDADGSSISLLCGFQVHSVIFGIQTPIHLGTYLVHLPSIYDYGVRSRATPHKHPLKHQTRKQSNNRRRKHHHTHKNSLEKHTTAPTLQYVYYKHTTFTLGVLWGNESTTHHTS